MKKNYFLLFLAIVILSLVLLYLIHEKTKPVVKPPVGLQISETCQKRPMVELTDKELNTIIGQAGLLFINSSFEIDIQPEDTIEDFQNKIINQLLALQADAPQQALITYSDMINLANNDPRFTVGPNTLHMSMNLQHVMENVVMSHKDFIIKSASEYGNFGIVGLEVNAPGTFHLFVRKQ